MYFRQQVKSPWPDQEHSEPELKEVILGLHWDPPKDGARRHPADLDVLCVLFDLEGRVFEVVHPGHPRSMDSSVVHTGDSRTGASTWDDERIFVFLNAVPKTVSRLAFVVLSSTGQPFDQVPGASCHISDRLSENVLARMDLTSLSGQTAHAITMVREHHNRWRIAADMPAVDARLLGDLRLLVKGAK